MTKQEDKYLEGTDMSGFEIIPGISSYNRNYYANAMDLLFAKSDDDNTTEWYLIKGSYQPIYLGYTLASERDYYLHKESNT